MLLRANEKLNEYPPPSKQPNADIYFSELLCM